jgi:site-specific DNA recombinase
VVRQIFAAYTQEGVSLRGIVQRLNAARVATRKHSRWDPFTISKLLRNPAYAGRACFGKTAVGPRGQITRRHSLKGRRPTGDTPNHDRPRSEWLEIPVPPLISEETFAVAHERLAQNTHFARRRTKTPTLLQGLLVCQQCGYSLYRRRRHYRCWGIDGYRHPHGPVCSNRPVRQDQLDALVWSEVLHLLDAPTLVQAELDRRLAAARQADPSRRVSTTSPGSRRGSHTASSAWSPPTNRSSSPSTNCANGCRPSGTNNRASRGSARRGNSHPPTRRATYASAKP